MEKENDSMNVVAAEAALLAKAYKGVDMGVTAAGALAEIACDTEFCALIKSHLNGYIALRETLAKKLCEREKTPKGLCPMEKTMLKMSVKLKTAMNKTTKKLSEMAFQGINMGVLEMCQILNSRKLSRENESFAREILLAYERYASELKAFL